MKLTYSIISNWYTTLPSKAERGHERVQSKYLSSVGLWSPTTVTVSPALERMQKKLLIDVKSNYKSWSSELRVDSNMWSYHFEPMSPKPLQSKTCECRGFVLSIQIINYRLSGTGKATNVNT